MTKSAKPWSGEKHPASTSALMASLHTLRQTNPKAVRSNVHIYPASIYDAGRDDQPQASSSDQKLPDRRITSWKMTEYMYRQSDNPFPTLARGLFTEDLEEDEDLPSEARNVERRWSDDQRRERIVGRGYDKFFNIDEVEWTSWKTMENHTEPPYYLTLKSNGCLILVSALSPSHLMIASKHSLGTTTDQDESNASSSKANGVEEGMQKLTLSNSIKGKEKAEVDEDDGETATAHAEMGRRWVRRMLHAAGKSEADLAARLWRDNLSAVLELCDDSFEEHVLVTPAHWTGLHLHGLNDNTPHFSTLTPPEVSAFAKEFGFIPTKYTQLESLSDVKAFTDKVEKDQSWEGEQIEGFVVRSTVAESSKDAAGKPPYRPGAPFFFKVKFNEPYLLYRQWRELTRVMLPYRDALANSNKANTSVPGSMANGKGKNDSEAELWTKVRKRYQRPEVAVYADWCAEMMKREPQLFDDYLRGIVRVRERFLAWTEGEGKEAWEEAKAGKYKLRGHGNKKSRAKEAAAVSKLAGVQSTAKKDKWLIVPMAIPGCGKTLIGVALSKLFGFGHTQSDDVTTKKSAPTFLKNIADLFKSRDVVFADRNNHIDKHYNELSALSSNKALSQFNLRLVAVVWNVTGPPYHRVIRVCSERVVSRGDNHRTLRPDTAGGGEHEAVVGQFLRNWTPPDPDMFESLISVEVEDDPKTCLAKVVDGLVSVMGLAEPSEEAIDAALKAGEQYRITGDYRPPTLQVAKPRYYGIAPELNIRQVMETALAEETVPEPARNLYETLKNGKRIIDKSHITVCHEQEVAEETSLSEPSVVTQASWDQCRESSKKGTLYQFQSTHLIWDDRVMCLAVQLLPTASRNSEEPNILDEVRRRLHITIGTINEDVRPWESASLVLAMRSAIENDAATSEVDEVVEGGGKVRWIALPDIKGEGKMRGMW